MMDKGGLDVIRSDCTEDWMVMVMDICTESWTWGQCTKQGLQILERKDSTESRVMISIGFGFVS